MRHQYIASDLAVIAQIMSLRANREDCYSAQAFVSPLTNLAVDTQTLWNTIAAKDGTLVPVLLKRAGSQMLDANASAASSPEFVGKTSDTWDKLIELLTIFESDLSEDLQPQFLLLKGLTFVNIAVYYLSFENTTLAMRKFDEALGCLNKVASMDDIAPDEVQTLDVSLRQIEQHASSCIDAENNPLLSMYGRAVSAIAFVPIVTSYMLNDIGIGAEALEARNQERLELRLLATTMVAQVTGMLELITIDG